MENGDVEILEIKKAGSKNVLYTDPVVLYQSSETKITVIPFYLDRSSGRRDVRVKITTEKKAKPPRNWYQVEEKSVSLNPDATYSLYASLRKFLSLTEHDQQGQYIVIKPKEGEYSLGNHQPDDVAQAVLGVLNEPEIAKHLVDKELGSELVNALRNSIRVNELRSAVAKLRTFLENGITDEQEYQTWCEEHSWIFGSAYLVNDEVRSISATDKVDLMLPAVITGYRDLVELKRPDMEVLNYDRSHNNYYFTSDVSKVIGQCHRYLEVFQEEAVKGMRDHPEIIAYHPKVTVVIGRSDMWDREKHKALHGLNSRLNSITIITFDQLLAQGERMIDVVSVQHNIDT